MTTENTEPKKRPIDEARERLKLLSLEVKDLVEDGTFFTINDAIVETLYKDDTHREFKSYRQWKKEGNQVRKGEKAFLLWARPKQIQKPIENGTTAEDLEEMIKYFPIAYLFSNAQIDPATDSEEASEHDNSGEENAASESQTEIKPTANNKISLEPLEY